MEASQSAALYGAADAGAQLVERRRVSDARRALSAAAFGAGVVGPVGYAWYPMLERVVLPGAALWRRVVAKTLVDLSVFGPAHTAGYLAVVGLLRGDTVAAVAEALRHDFVPTLCAETAFFGCVQVVNFSVTPVRYQLLAINCAGFLDATALSLVSSTPGGFAELASRLAGRGGDGGSGVEGR